MEQFAPEGQRIHTEENRRRMATPAALREAMLRRQVLEARAAVCDSAHNLIVPLPCMRGIIPREEGALGIREGQTRDIALIARVNKPVCFVVEGISTDENGEPLAVLSRRKVQERCKAEYLANLQPGDIVPACVTHLEPFGCFVDIGCGIPSLIPIDAISVSRIAHPEDRFVVGQQLRVIFKGRDGEKILLSHKELLGTWEENAAQFAVGETVGGIVRSVEDYGVFVELAPNLAGLAEPHRSVKIGQHASVYIKSILPDRMKLKLVIVDVFDSDAPPAPPHYFYTGDHIARWDYTPHRAVKRMVSEFS